MLVNPHVLDSSPGCHLDPFFYLTPLSGNVMSWSFRFAAQDQVFDKNLLWCPQREVPPNLQLIFLLADPFPWQECRSAAPNRAISRTILSVLDVVVLVRPHQTFFLFIIIVFDALFSEGRREKFV
jgi:hypothetical protein